MARAAALQSVAVRQSTGKDVSGHYFHHFFSRFSPSGPFLIEAILWPSGGHFGYYMWFRVSHRRSAPIKKLILRKMIGVPINLELDPFPDPVAKFGAPSWPFWI